MTNRCSKVVNFTLRHDLVPDLAPMASPDFSKSARERTEANEMLNDAHQWGEAILRAKTTLIKPHSKVKT